MGDNTPGPSKRQLLLDAVLERTAPLTAIEFRILVQLWGHADADTLVCWPSHARLAKLAGCSPDHARHAIQGLDKKGWLDRAPVPGRSNRYTLHEPPTEGRTDTTAPHERRADVIDQGPWSYETRGVVAGSQTIRTPPENTAKGTPPKRRGRKSSTFTASDFGSLDWPDSLDSEEGRAVLSEWLDHKREQGKPYKGTSGPQRILNDFADAGVDALRAAVNASIRNNWAGLFPSEKGKRDGHHRADDDDPRGNFAVVAEYLAERSGTAG